MFIPSNFIYSFHALQDIRNTVMIQQIWIYINIQVMNIHKYTSYYIIEIHINRLITTTQIFIAIDCLIHINRLITTTQIFIAMDYLIMMSEKYLYFRKRKKHLARTFFTHPIEVTGSMYFGNIFRIMCLPKICTKT